MSKAMVMMEHKEDHHQQQQQPTDDDDDDPWSDENVDAMARLWKLTVEEREKMLLLKIRLHDLAHHWKYDPYEVVRFFHECKGNMSLTEQRFRAMIQWRISEHVDTILQRYTPDPLFRYFPSVVLDGVDHEGDPILLERSGKLDAWGFLQKFGVEKMLEFITYRRERQLTRHKGGWQREIFEPRNDGKQVARFTVIMDMEGLGRQHLRPGLLPLLQKMARVQQDMYAGVCKCIIVLRAPAIFKAFWALVKHFVDPHIRELLIITNHSNYMDVLDQHLDRNVLPGSVFPEFGEGGVMPGFENVFLEGGPLPVNNNFDSSDKDDKETVMETSSVTTGDSSILHQTSGSSSSFALDSDGEGDATSDPVGISARTLGKGLWNYDSSGPSSVMLFDDETVGQVVL